MNRFRDMAIQNYARRLTAVILDLSQPEIEPFDPTTSKTLPQNQTRSGSDDPFLRYGHLKFSKMAASCYLRFGPTGSRSIRSAVPCFRAMCVCVSVCRRQVNQTRLKQLKLLTSNTTCSQGQCGHDPLKIFGARMT